MISIILSSRSLIYSFAFFSLLFIDFGLALTSANEFLNFDCLIFIVSSSLLQWSAFLLIAFLNSFSILLRTFWNQALVDWKGLFHFFFSGNFLHSFNWEWFSASSFYLYFSDSMNLEETFTQVLKGYFYMRASLYSPCGVRDLFSMDGCHIFLQCVLTIIPLMGAGLVLWQKPALHVQQGLLFALWLSQPCWGTRSAPQLE